MPDAQPKPTAAEVLYTHRRLEWVESSRGVTPGYYCIDQRCMRPVIGGLWQHQADMLAAAGLLVTAEHDAQVAAETLLEAAGRVLDADEYTWDQDAEVARRGIAAMLRADAEDRDGQHVHTWTAGAYLPDGSEDRRWLACIACHARLARHHRADLTPHAPA